MKELGIKYYSNEDYRELFNIMIDSNTCEDFAIGISNDGKLLYVENKLMNNSSAYWVQSLFLVLIKRNFAHFLSRQGQRVI